MTQRLKYESVRDQLKSQIESGELQPGSRLKNEVDMATEYGVSAITIRRAMMDLVAEGYISRKRGAGTYVAQFTESPELPELLPPVSTNNKLVVLLLNQESYSNDSLVRIIAGAQRTLNRHGSNMLIDWNSTIPKISASSIERMLQQNVDGFLIYPFDPQQNREEFQMIRDNGKPYVLLDRRDAYMPSLYVGSNNFDGGILATKALLDLGHEKICFVGHLFFLSSERERYSGFLSALYSAGLKPAPNQLMEQADYNLLARLIRSGEITALFCVSDRIAEKAVCRLTEMGIRVPEDVSIIGFDDNNYNANCPVALSTVRQNFELLGQRAAELLLWALDQHDAAPRDMQIQTGVELVLRSSTRKL